MFLTLDNCELKETLRNFDPLNPKIKLNLYQEYFDGC